MTYNVFGGTLNLAQSQSQFDQRFDHFSLCIV